VDISDKDLNNLHLPIFYAFGSILDERAIKEIK
jgi:hypothetical protein